MSCRQVALRRCAWLPLLVAMGFGRGGGGSSVAWTEEAAAVATPPLAAAKTASADAAWRVILSLDAGPAAPPAGVRTREAAAALARQHLDRQEAALRSFPAEHPADPRRFAARVRLADVLCARARLLGELAPRTEARRLLDAVEADPAAAPADRADAAYARVSQTMQELAGARSAAEVAAPTESVREGLARTIRGFDRAHPGDARTPALLAELATLYDAQPGQKKALLDEVLARLPAGPAGDNLRMRAGDDLRRLALLGKPLDLRLPPRINPSEGREPAVAETLAAHRGRVVVLLFWASWSAPALAEFTRLQTLLAARGDLRGVEILTVSLDEDRAALTEALRQLRVTWPVFCDGRGWSGEAVRAVGLNALPTTWVLDRHGVLLTLNARGRTEEWIRQATQTRDSSAPARP